MGLFKWRFLKPPPGGDSLAPRGTSGERAGERGSRGGIEPPLPGPTAIDLRGIRVREAEHPRSKRLLSPALSSIPNGGEGETGRRPFLKSMAVRPGRGGLQLLRVRWIEALILLFAAQFDASCPAVQCLPDLQQHSFAIGAPLMIPESQHLDVLLGEKLLPFLVALDVPGEAMLRTIQLHRQPRHRAITVEKVIAFRMLAAKFEASKTTCFHRAPKLLFLVRLITSKLSGACCAVHAGMINRPWFTASEDVPSFLPQRGTSGARFLPLLL